MRGFELLLFAALLTYCWNFDRIYKTRWLICVVATLIIVLICHITVDEPRWQMAGAYIAMAILFAASFNQFKETGTENAQKDGKADKAHRIKVNTTIIVLSSAFLSLTIPITELPEPTGQYKIGTKQHCLEDQRRNEIFDETKPRRSLPIQIWYPANSNKTELHLAPYMMPSYDFNNLRKAPLPSFLASYLHLIKTHAQQDAPLATGTPSSAMPSRYQWPVIVFSHGLMGGRIQNTIQAEELASHGFIVVALDHPYDAAFSVFPDRHVICSQLLAGRPPSVPEIRTNGFATRVKDVQFVIDELDKLNKNDPSSFWTGNIDLTRIGCMGHSFGGATTVEVTAIDKRVKAGLCMDGGVMNLQGCTKPIMILQADRGERDPLGVEKFLCRQEGEFYNLKIPGAQHANFTDLPILTSLHWVIGLSGSIHPDRCEEIINAYTLNFFEKCLKNQNSKLLSLSADRFPEVKLKHSSAKHK